METKFKILCDVCGTEWKAFPDTPWMPQLSIPENSITMAIVEVCPNCILKPRPVSSRIKFVSDILNENQRLKDELNRRTK